MIEFFLENKKEDMLRFHDNIRFYNLYLVTLASVLNYFYESSS